MVGPQLVRLQELLGFPAVAFQADEPGYPADRLELIAEVRLRDELHLVDGDPISFAITP